MDNLIHISTENKNIKLELGDELQIEGDASSISFNGNNLLSFMFHFIDDFTIAELKKYEESDVYKSFMKKIKSIRKTEEECFHCIRDIYFDDYIECSNDVQSLLCVDAGHYLKTNIDDYVIVEVSIDDYIRANIDYLMTMYETMHDQILLKLEFFKHFDIVLEDDKVELWEDYDEHIKIDWGKLETWTADKFNDGELSVYAIRKVRKEIARYKQISTNGLTYFTPLKESYERKYYQLQGAKDERTNAE